MQWLIWLTIGKITDAEAKVTIKRKIYCNVLRMYDTYARLSDYRLWSTHAQINGHHVPIHNGHIAQIYHRRIWRINWHTKDSNSFRTKYKVTETKRQNVVKKKKYHWSTKEIARPRPMAETQFRMEENRLFVVVVVFLMWCERGLEIDRTCSVFQTNDSCVDSGNNKVTHRSNTIIIGDGWAKERKKMAHRTWSIDPLCSSAQLPYFIFLLLRITFTCKRARVIGMEKFSCRALCDSVISINNNKKKSIIWSSQMHKVFLTLCQRGIFRRCRRRQFHRGEWAACHACHEQIRSMCSTHTHKEYRKIIVREIISTSLFS